ncbi:MAG TPA: hypothetical protein PKY12_03445 [Catalimonadaceae bacterium]|nr:hypothetical protein [Catalimonadaceae bacterium]
MNRFLQRIGLFLLAIVAANGLAFLLISNIYLKEYGVEDDHLRKFDAFLFADSHGLPLGRETENFGLFNFSSASDTYGDVFRKLNYLISHVKVPKLVVLTADDHTLSPYRDRVNNYDRSIAYADFGSSYFTSFGRFEVEKHLRYYCPVLNPKDRDLIRLFAKGQFRKWTSNGTGSMDKNWAKIAAKKEESRLRADWQFPSKTPSELQKNHLINILNLCRKNGIQVIGIKFPLTQDYQKAIEGKNYKADSLILNGGGFAVDDFSAVQWPDSIFENQDHLNKLGGKKLNELLKEDLPDPQNPQKPSILNPRSF